MRYLCWLVEFGHGANGPSLWSCAGACCCHAHMGRAHSFAGRAHAAAGGEKRDESTAGTPLSCVAAWAVHALCARRPCESRTMSENVSTADLSQRYGSPYAERGHVCVRCMVLCVAERVRGGRGVRPHARGGRRVLEGRGPAERRFFTHTLFFRFLDHLPPQHVLNKCHKKYLCRARVGAGSESQSSPLSPGP